MSYYKRLLEKQKTVYDKPGSYRTLDPTIEKILTEVAAEMNIEYVMVRKVVMHFFYWLRSSMSKAEYSAYNIKRFGTFIFFFKRTGGPDSYMDNKKFKKEAIAYEARYRKLKDSNRKFNEEELKNIKESDDYQQKIDLINEISQFHPSIVKQFTYPPYKKKVRDLGWWVGGNKEEGGWNENTMLFRTVDDLIDVNKLFVKENVKRQFKFKPK